MQRLNLRDRFSSLLLNSDIELLELFLALIALIYGVWESFPQFPSANGLAPSSDRAIALTWLCLIKITGGARVYGLLRDRLRWRQVGAFISVLIWIFFEVLLLQNGVGVRVALTSLFVLADIWIYLRLAKLDTEPYHRSIR